MKDIFCIDEESCLGAKPGVAVVGGRKKRTKQIFLLQIVQKVAAPNGLIKQIVLTILCTADALILTRLRGKIHSNDSYCFLPLCALGEVSICKTK